MKTNQRIARGIAKIATIGSVALCAVYGGENDAYENRAFFRILDSQGNETRRIVAGTNEYTLEAFVENVSELKKPVVNINLDVNVSDPLFVAGALPFDDNTKEHYLGGDYFSNLKMSINRVRDGGSLIRETYFEAGQPREAVSAKMANVVGKWKLRVFDRITVTNVLYNTIGFDKFAASENGGTEKSVCTRSLKVQVVPQGYNELNLMCDFNDGETPANDSFKYDVFGRATPVMVPGSVPEPIVIGNGKANVLERSVGDASGPWTAVWTNRPTAGNMSASGAFSDREMKGFEKVFYRVVPYNGQ